MTSKAMDYENLNENVKKCQYAVRGELYLRASELQKEGKKIIFTNVGNPHALGQKPLTFPRQVIALCQAPFLLDDPNVGLVFPADAIARAKQYLSMTSGGLGAYSDSRGIPGVRKEVAEFIGRRDGYPSDPELIFLTDGASKGVMQILNSIIRGPSDGILVPVPQYPLYSATISLLGGSLVPYYLEETANWGLDINDLRRSVADARSKGLTIRAMVIINPGNPTGQCLSEANLKEILQFCYRENLVLLGDEVYQQNIYQDERPFLSSRKVLLDMGPPISKELQLVSFHTVSKGYWGECGQRGGYFEMTNISPRSVEEIYKVASISLSPNVPGQIFLGLMMNPPKPGDISYDQFARESKGILESLRKRAHIMTDGFNSCRNVVCNFTEGAMYSFPQIRLPPRAIETAQGLGKAPDVYYCLKLLEATGISTVPGSGFGQKEGVFHLRTTILPAEEDMPAIMASFKKFNDEFMDQYEDHRVQTDLQAGAQYKYGLLWIILLASFAALLIQSLAANLGVVTGKHLAEHCRKEYPRVPNFVLWVLAEVAIVACDIPEVIGTAFALNMLFKIPLWCGVLITGFSTLVLLLLQQYGVRKLEIFIAFLVFTIVGCFCVELGYAKPKSSEVLEGLFVPKLKGTGATKLAISLLGAMVMPHNLFLHSALVLSRKIPRSLNGIKEACTFYLIESGIALIVAFIINVCVISVSGAVCNSPNLSEEYQESCSDLDLNKASFLLKNVLGNWSSKLFAIALLASGQSSTITGTYAGQYVMQGFLDLRLRPWIRNMITRCLAIVPSLIVSIIGGSAGAGNLIIIASMILSFELPFALVPLLKFTSSKTKMGLHANSKIISTITWIIGLLIMGINIYYLAEKLVTSLKNSDLKMVGKVFCGILGFTGLLVYLGSIAYLVIRENKERTHLLALTAVDGSSNGNEPSLPREDIRSMQLPEKRSTSDVE